MGRSAHARATPPPARVRAAEVDDLTLRRAQQGERAALEQVVERYHPMVHALVWRMACAQGDAHIADLVQDSLLRVIQALPRFSPNGPAKLSTWILTIATRVVLNDRRRIRPSEDVTDEPTAHIDPATSASDRQLATALATAILQLPEQQRIVLVLREYHDLDYSEIAKALDTDVGTIKSRISRARAAVRELLERALPDLFRGDR